MALAIGYTDNQDGTFSVTVSNMSSSGRTLKLLDNGTGESVSMGTGGAFSATYTFVRAHIGSSTTVSATVVSGSGTVLQTGTAGAICTIRGPSVTATTNGPYTGCSWVAPPMNNTAYTFHLASIQDKIGSGATAFYGFSASPTGSVPSTSVYAGYSTTVAWTVTHSYTHPSFGNVNTGAGSGSATTAASPPAPPPPPTAPNPATALTAVDHTTNVALAWAASAGGATGYQIKRNGTVLTTTSGTTYTDSSPPARPVTYTVTAYNTNASGTAYAAGVSVSVGGAVGAQQQMVV